MTPSTIQGSLLHIAVAQGATEAAKVLTTHLCRAGLALDPLDGLAETPLFLAVKTGECNIAALLLQAGADVNSMSGKAYLERLGRDLDTASRVL